MIFLWRGIERRVKIMRDLGILLVLVFVFVTMGVFFFGKHTTNIYKILDKKIEEKIRKGKY